jgi:hypothetical protein
MTGFGGMRGRWAGDGGEDPVCGRAGKLQHPLRGDVSPLLPVRSIDLFFGIWIPPGDALIPRAGSGGQRHAAASVLGGAFSRER